MEAIGREQASIVVEMALVGTGWDVAAKDAAVVMEEGGNGCGSGNGRERLSAKTGFVVVGGRGTSKLFAQTRYLKRWKRPRAAVAVGRRIEAG